MKVILASASPRRREILSGFGLEFDVITADVDESVEETDKITGERRPPAEIVEEISRRKARAVLERVTDTPASVGETVIIAADTVVCSEGEILGKPHNRADAKRMLLGYSGKTHEVISAVTLESIDGSGAVREQSFHEISRVTFKEMSDEEIEHYLDSEEPYDKAGAYAVQGMASLFIDRIEGGFYNIVGLPVRGLYEALGGIGFFKKG